MDDLLCGFGREYIYVFIYDAVKIRTASGDDERRVEEEQREIGFIYRKNSAKSVNQ